MCVGPRSAVFAPIDDLGLIVVDEEHDASYKHEGDPRYDARDVAAERAGAAAALLLLGSATPRPESVQRLPASRLPRRVDGRPLPAVQVLDMRGAAAGPAPASPRRRSPTCARARGKAIVLLNRRGWSNFLSCRSCGRVWSCPHCDVALVLHRADGYLACHHCGHREPVPARCARLLLDLRRPPRRRHRAPRSTSSPSVLDDGDFPVFRLDADAVARPAASGPRRRCGAILRRFRRPPMRGC